MTASPFDMPGSARPRPHTLTPVLAPAPAAEPAPEPPAADAETAFRPPLVIEVPPPPGDAYERPVGSVLKVFPTRADHYHVRIGIRHDRQRVETRLSPARMRQLAADLNARADLLDPPGGHAA